MLRLHIPLVEPDMRITRIRLSSETRQKPGYRGDLFATLP
jgi:hypothetical protein